MPPLNDPHCDEEWFAGLRFFCCYCKVPSHTLIHFGYILSIGRGTGELDSYSGLCSVQVGFFLTELQYEPRPSSTLCRSTAGTVRDASGIFGCGTPQMQVPEFRYSVAWSPTNILSRVGGRIGAQRDQQVGNELENSMAHKAFDLDLSAAYMQPYST